MRVGLLTGTCKVTRRAFVTLMFARCVVAACLAATRCKLSKASRNARPGKTGERNAFRNVGFLNTDLGLGKTIKMPYSERHGLQIRFEMFNLFNYQAMGTFDTSRSGYGIPLDPGAKQPPVNFGRYTAIQGTPRFGQFLLRYSF